MLTFKFESPDTSQCECCGGQTTVLTRFVYRDGDAHAVYYARYSDNYPDRVVTVTISLGEWGKGANPDQRVAFALEIHSTENEYQIGLIDAERSPWREAKILGRTLDRSEALAHPLVNEVFHITDHIVAEDTPIHEYLNH